MLSHAVRPQKAEAEGAQQMNVISAALSATFESGATVDTVHTFYG